MANIKITVEGPLMDGHKVTFKAPCNCDVVEKLDVRYIENNTQKSKLFTMKDAHGNDLTGLGNLFFKDAYVDVVLDPNSGSAYLQNAGTNGYLEGKTTPVDNLESDRADLPLSARQGKILNESLDKVRTYVGSDGKLHFVDASGADSVLPFSSVKRGTFTLTGVTQTIELGFKPKYLLVSQLPYAPATIYEYDENVSKEGFSMLLASNGASHVGFGSLGDYLNILDNGFTVRAHNTQYENKEAHYIAF